MFRFLKSKNSGQNGSEKNAVQDSHETGHELSQLITREIPMVEVIPRVIQQNVRGTHRRFSEHLDYNISLIATRLPTEDLVYETFKLGSISKRRVAVVYLKDRADIGLVNEIKTRVMSIKSEIVLDSSYIERNIEDSSLSPFPQVEITMRPDVAEGALIKGRVVIITDDSPNALLAPTTFFDLMDTPGDFFTRWFVAASFFRIVRYLMFIFAISLPAFYIALQSYNPELIPTRLLMSILASASGTPFPVYFEAFFMMGTAEAIRIMMQRMPTQTGTVIALFSGIALVGAGLAANIISETIVVIVTLTMVCSFGIPNYDLRSSVRLIQFFTMVMVSFFGLFGFAVAFFYLGIHLVSLKSFGIPYMTPLSPLEGSGLGHTLLRENTVAMTQDETYKPQRNK